MKLYKKITTLLLIMMMTTSLLVGCGKANTKVNDESKKETTAEEKPVVKEEVKSVEITDALGRVVKLEKEPERIVSAYYLTTSLILSLGAKDKLVGIELKANEREMYKRVAPELIDLPGVGNSKNINVEECLAQKAELVIIPVRLKEFIPQFEKLNIPVIAVDPETLDGFKDTIRMVSKAVFEEAKGEELINYYDTTVEKVSNLTKNITTKYNVYMSGSDSVLKTVTSKMYQNYLIETCGGTNVTSALTDGYWANISVEELIKYNPDKIFLVGYATYSIEDVLNDATLANVNAVKNKEVYIFPSKLEPWDYPTSTSVLGMLWLVNKLYPEVYSVEDYKKDAKDYFNKVYGIEVTEDEIGL